MSEELLTEQIEEDLKNAKVELERSEKSLAEHKEALALWVSMTDALEKVAPILINKCRKIKGQETFEYELEDAYWDQVRAASELDIFQKLSTYKEKNIPQLLKVVEAKTEAVDSLKEKISRMEGDDE